MSVERHGEEILSRVVVPVPVSSLEAEFERVLQRATFPSVDALTDGLLEMGFGAPVVEILLMLVDGKGWAILHAYTRYSDE